MYDGVNILSPVIYCCIVLKLGNKVDNQIHMETLTLIHIGRAREVFQDVIIFFALAAPF